MIGSKRRIKEGRMHSISRMLFSWPAELAIIRKQFFYDTPAPVSRSQPQTSFAIGRKIPMDVLYAC